eukprot:185548-Karenia_brevis.AAC.1
MSIEVGGFFGKTGHIGPVVLVGNITSKSNFAGNSRQKEGRKTFLGTKTRVGDPITTRLGVKPSGINNSFKNIDAHGPGPFPLPFADRSGLPKNGVSSILANSGFAKNWAPMFSENRGSKSRI